jgi:hypothetical protein
MGWQFTKGKIATAMRVQLRKPGACGVLSLEVKYDPAFRLKCTGTLIIDDNQHSRKSCHDEYEFKTVPFTIPCCKLHFYHPKLLHIKLQFSKRNKQTPLLPLPEINSIYHAESAGSRDQPRPGSFLKKREEPGNEVGFGLVVGKSTRPSICTSSAPPPNHLVPVFHVKKR